MGTVIFPNARLKIFLDASLEERASRRYKQLREKGIDASITSLFDELAERDRRDRSRAVSPLKPAADAVTIDSSALGIQDVLAQVLALWQQIEK
jgi:cytidylate kinase